MLKRIATAVVLIPIVMLLVLRAPVPVLAVFAAAVALVTVQEFLKLTESYGVQPLRLPTYIFVGLLFLLLAASAAAETPIFLKFDSERKTFESIEKKIAIAMTMTGSPTSRP